MSHKSIHNIPLNRAEGDLEIKVEIEDGMVWYRMHGVRGSCFVELKSY